MDECRNITETFPLGKTDGLPIPFYNVFWSLIVKIWLKILKRPAKERRCLIHNGRVLSRSCKKGKYRTYLILVTWHLTTPFSISI